MSLTPEQHAEFIRRFPAADAFMVHCELSNELATLRNCSHRNDWQNRRLAELETWKEHTP